MTLRNRFGGWLSRMLAYGADCLCLPHLETLPWRLPRRIARFPPTKLCVFYFGSRRRSIPRSAARQWNTGRNPHQTPAHALPRFLHQPGAA